MDYDIQEDIAQVAALAFACGDKTQVVRKVENVNQNIDGYRLVVKDKDKHGNPVNYEIVILDRNKDGEFSRGRDDFSLRVTREHNKMNILEKFFHKLFRPNTPMHLITCGVDSIYDHNANGLEKEDLNDRHYNGLFHSSQDGVISPGSGWYFGGEEPPFFRECYMEDYNGIYKEGLQKILEGYKSKKSFRDFVERK